MRKTFLGIILVLFIFLGINMEGVHAANASTLNVHYYRYDETYTDWSLWVWEGENDGVRHNFTSTDGYGKVATIDIAATYGDVDEVGILVSYPDWSAKDFDANRFIDLTNPNSNGVVDVYLLQGEEFISYTAIDKVGCDHQTPDAALCSQVVTSGLLNAFMNENYKIEFSATDVLSASNITVYENDVVVPFTGFTSGTSGQLTIANIDASKTYTVSVEYNGEITSKIVVIDTGYDSQIFADAYHYDGALGPIYSLESTTLKLWAPVSSEVEVNLYTKGHTTTDRYDGVNDPYITKDLTYVGNGVWEIVLDGDMHGVYYTYNVMNGVEYVKDVQDPYGQTFGLNGARSMIIDLDRVSPEGWDLDKGIDGYTNPNDAVIYELHIRDLTSDSTWGGPSEYRNTYMGLTVDNTSYTNSISNVTVTTGLAHLKELGITHLHLLPTYDQDWNDERNFSFNWGYNPQNYNSPEGGYSTDPYDGSVRVLEYKEMVMALHDNGINVVNDVVYNHTGPGSYYSFNRIVPDYFSRTDIDGNYLNASGCGNETASERYMVHKFIVDSVEYWAEEYHIDGFRFDLMQIHDVDTMNDLAEKVEALDPDIFVYGEPWAAGSVGIPYGDQAGKNNLTNMPLISAFNDNFRNAIKGSPDGAGKGFVSTGYGTSDIKNGISGSQNWDYGNYSYQSINYTTAHDNLTLYDKLKLANGESVYTKAVDYQARQANSIVMFSQGTPFLHAGVDFLRSKGGNHNSYEAPDSVNQLDYSRKSIYINSFEYYKGIIEIRKEFASFTMSDYNDINENITFLNPNGYGMIGYNLTKNDEDILVYFHGGDARNITLDLPSGAWELIVDRDEAGLDKDMGTYATNYPIEPYETLVFVRGDSNDVITSPEHQPEAAEQPLITNSITTIVEGGTYRLNADRNIISYSIDGSSVTVAETKYLLLSDLSVGEHIIIVTTKEGGVSNPFTLTVTAQPEETCDENPDQDKCTDTINPDPVDPDPVDSGDKEPTVPDTGCFSALKSSGLFVVAISLIGGVALLVVRKKS
jgi:pullulanase